MIELDGSHGEGGGQILRTALALSLVTQRPFTLSRIRAGRPKPGLMRQHLACVLAACEIAPGALALAPDGSALGIGSGALRFEPAPVRAGRYRFEVGSAGSTMLVLQTLLWPLLQADSASELTLVGGTHNPMAPSATFLQQLGPVMGAGPQALQLELLRHGFYPAGGGEVRVHLNPAARKRGPLALHARGALQGITATVLHAGVPRHVASNMLAGAQSLLQLPDAALTNRALRGDEGPGAVLLVHASFEHTQELVAGYAERGVSAQRVAQAAAEEMQAYLAHTAPVGEHLADQLMLPLALNPAGGSYRCTQASSHLRTNLHTIEQFLPGVLQLDDLGALGWQVSNCYSFDS